LFITLLNYEAKVDFLFEKNKLQAAEMYIFSYICAVYCAI